MALIRTGATAQPQPQTYGTYHGGVTSINANVGDVIDVIWENASVPTFSGCTQETIFSISSSKKVIRLTATGTTISYSGDNYMMCYITY